MWKSKKQIHNILQHIQCNYKILQWLGREIRIKIYLYIYLYAFGSSFTSTSLSYEHKRRDQMRNSKMYKAVFGKLFGNSFLFSNTKKHFLKNSYKQISDMGLPLTYFTKQTTKYFSKNKTETLIRKLLTPSYRSIFKTHAYFFSCDLLLVNILFKTQNLKQFSKWLNNHTLSLIHIIQQKMEILLNLDSTRLDTLLYAQTTVHQKNITHAQTNSEQKFIQLIN